MQKSKKRRANEANNGQEQPNSELKKEKQRQQQLKKKKKRKENSLSLSKMIHILFQKSASVGHIFQCWIIENVKIRPVKYESVWGGKNEKRLA